MCKVEHLGAQKDGQGPSFHGISAVWSWNLGQRGNEEKTDTQKNWDVVGHTCSHRAQITITIQNLSPVNTEEGLASLLRKSP